MIPEKEHDHPMVIISSLSQCIDGWTEDRSLLDLPEFVSDIYAIDQFVTISQNGAIDNWVKWQSNHDEPSCRLHITARAIARIDTSPAPINPVILEGIRYLAKRADEDGFDSIVMTGEEMDADTFYSQLAEATYNIGSPHESSSFTPFMDAFLLFVESHRTQLEQFLEELWKYE